MAARGFTIKYLLPAVEADLPFSRGKKQLSVEEVAEGHSIASLSRVCDWLNEVLLDYYRNTAEMSRVLTRLLLFVLTLISNFNPALVQKPKDASDSPAVDIMAPPTHPLSSTPSSSQAASASVDATSSDVPLSLSELDLSSSNSEHDYSNCYGSDSA